MAISNSMSLHNLKILQDKLNEVLRRMYVQDSMEEDEVEVMNIVEDDMCFSDPKSLNKMQGN